MFALRLLFASSGALLVAYGIRVATVAVLAAGLLLIAAVGVHMIAKMRKRHEAVVFVKEWTTSRQIWRETFRFRWTALRAARRQAARSDCLGDVYSQYPVCWKIVDLKRTTDARAAHIPGGLS
jgi:predicted lysophospholipase L1 biosynthesis ABC-type transport system permease subunit